MSWLSDAYDDDGDDTGLWEELESNGVIEWTDHLYIRIHVPCRIHGMVQFWMVKSRGKAVGGDEFNFIVTRKPIPGETPCGLECAHHCEAAPSSSAPAAAAAPSSSSLDSPSSSSAPAPVPSSSSLDPSSSSSSSV